MHLPSGRPFLFAALCFVLCSGFARVLYALRYAFVPPFALSPRYSSASSVVASNS